MLSQATECAMSPDTMSLESGSTCTADKPEVDPVTFCFVNPSVHTDDNNNNCTYAVSTPADNYVMAKHDKTTAEFWNLLRDLEGGAFLESSSPADQPQSHAPTTNLNTSRSSWMSSTTTTTTMKTWTVNTEENEVRCQSAGTSGEEVPYRIKSPERRKRPLIHAPPPSSRSCNKRTRPLLEDAPRARRTSRPLLDDIPRPRRTSRHNELVTTGRLCEWKNSD